MSSAGLVDHGEDGNKNPGHHTTSRVFIHCAACGGEGGAVNGWSITKQRVHRMRKTEMPGG